MRFTSNKKIELGSAAFRQWKSIHSHCQFVHGYRLTADITFEADELDERNWIMDFGGLKELKKNLQETFDHKLVVAEDDPNLELFKQLEVAGGAEIVILPAVGCERFAEFVLIKADDFVKEKTGGRVRVQQVTIHEHEDNYATCHREAVRGCESFTANLHETLDATIPKEVAETVEDQHGPVAQIEAPKVEEPKAEQHRNDNAPVGNTGTQTKGNWFGGTTWG